MAYDKVIDSSALDAGMTATANAIRAKTGGTDPIEWDSANGFKAAVEEIADGGGIAVTGATVGQTVKIAEVDENGVPTAWEAVEFPSGGLELVASVQLEERVVSVELPLSKPCNELVVQIYSDNTITGAKAMFCTVADDVATPVASRVTMRINDRGEVWLAGNIQTSTNNPKHTITSRVHLSSNASVSTMGANSESSRNGYSNAVQTTQVALFEDTSISKITLYGHDLAHHFYAGVKITVWGS